MSNFVLGPIFLSRDTDISLFDENQGLSGTGYAAVQLFKFLQEALPGEESLIVTIGGKFNNSSGGSHVCLSSIDDFQSDGETIVCPVESLVLLSPHQVAGSRVIAISQHPHDADLRRVRKRLKPWLEIHVSRYSFWSNFTLLRKICFVPNPLWSVPRENITLAKSSPSKDLVIGYLGSLVAEKGFMHLAKQWGTIRQNFPTARLEVVGGSSLYGKEESHEYLPTDSRYGEKIIAAFGTRDFDKTLGVSFLGWSGKKTSEVLQHWDYAVCNPTGHTESFCYSARECIAMGVPTFFGDGEGLSEIAAAFPELALEHPSDLPQKLRHVNGTTFPLESLMRRMKIWSSGNESDLRRSLGLLLGLLSSGTSRFQAIKLSVSSWPTLPLRAQRELGRNALKPCVDRCLDFKDRVYVLGKNLLGQPVYRRRTRKGISR